MYPQTRNFRNLQGQLQFQHPVWGLAIVLYHDGSLKTSHLLIFFSVLPYLIQACSHANKHLFYSYPFVPGSSVKCHILPFLFCVNLNLQSLLPSKLKDIKDMFGFSQFSAVYENLSITIFDLFYLFQCLQFEKVKDQAAFSLFELQSKYSNL